MEIRNFRDITFRIYRTELNNPVQLVLFHGICEHSFRYIPFIKALNKIGFDCTLIDHPGHGQHVLKEIFDENLYSFYDSIEDDLEKATHTIQTISNSDQRKLFQKRYIKENKKLRMSHILSFHSEFHSFIYREKIFSRNLKSMILGQSLGGLISTCLENELNDISGTILLSPAFKAQAKPASDDSTLEKIRSSFENSIIKENDKDEDQKSLFNTTVLKPLLALNPINNCSWAGEYISDIEEVNNLFSQAPFIGQKLSLKFLQSIQNKMKEQKANKNEFSHPVFLQFGTNDKIVHPDGSREFIHNRLKGNQHFFKALNNFTPHEIHNSKRRNYLLNDIKEWLQRLDKTL